MAYIIDRYCSGGGEKFKANSFPNLAFYFAETFKFTWG
jgi:hypothetical protein